MFLLGLLNSKLFWFFIKNTGYVLRGGYYTFKTNYIYPFPIPNYDCIKQELISKVEKEVELILASKRKEKDINLSNSLNTIDTYLYKIYGFNNEDILTIEK
jgi:hypothetical protein